MTERVTARRDIQRPLDESVPVGTTGDQPPPPLRPAVPDLSEQDPAAGMATATASVPATGRATTGGTDTGPATATMVDTLPEAGPVADAGAAHGAAPTVPGPAEEDRSAGTPARRGGGIRRVMGAPRRALRAPRRAVRACRAWSGRPSGRFVLPSALMLVLLAAAVTAGELVVPRPAGTGETDLAGAPVVPPAASTAPTAPPVRPSAGPGDIDTSTGRPVDALRGWAQQMSVRTGIPVVAMQAYGYAELVVTETTPGCRLSWTTLAGIGLAESNHGSSGSATLQSDGRAWPEIIGLPLDGQEDRKLITDTDSGRLDGDPVYDRAVGPMQFLPQTWSAERVDASGDGVADPHSIHDAALAAANYLCRGGRDLSAAADWWAAVLAYNEVQEYAQQVFDAANDYGRRSR